MGRVDVRMFECEKLLNLSECRLAINGVPCFPSYLIKHQFEQLLLRAMVSICVTFFCLSSCTSLMLLLINACCFGGSLYNNFFEFYSINTLQSVKELLHYHRADFSVSMFEFKYMCAPIIWPNWKCC